MRIDVRARARAVCAPFVRILRAFLHSLFYTLRLQTVLQTVVRDGLVQRAACWEPSST